MADHRPTASVRALLLAGIGMVLVGCASPPAETEPPRGTSAAPRSAPAPGRTVRAELVEVQETRQALFGTDLERTHTKDGIGYAAGMRFRFQVLDEQGDELIVLRARAASEMLATDSAGNNLSFSLGWQAPIGDEPIEPSMRMRGFPGHANRVTVHCWNPAQAATSVSLHVDVIVMTATSEAREEVSIARDWTSVPGTPAGSAQYRTLEQNGEFAVEVRGSDGLDWFDGVSFPQGAVIRTEAGESGSQIWTARARPDGDHRAYIHVLHDIREVRVSVDVKDLPRP